MKESFSLFKRANWTEYGLETISINDVVNIIRTGDYIIDDRKNTGRSFTLKQITELIHQTPPEQQQLAKKMYLPAITLNGIYKDGIEEYSSYTAIDFDHIPNQSVYNELYRRLTSTPCVRNIFQSPSGHGLKAIVLHDNNDMRMHGNLYKQLLEYFNNPYVSADTKNRDLSRRTYLCHDPNIWTNPNVVPFHFEYKPSLDRKIKVDKNPYEDKSEEDRKFLEFIDEQDSICDKGIMSILRWRCRHHHLQYLQEGHRRDGAFWFGTQAARAGVGMDVGLKMVVDLYNSEEIILTAGRPFTEDEAEENFCRGYKAESYDKGYRKSFGVKDE